MAFGDELPWPERPTFDPEFEGMYPPINVFDLLPVVDGARITGGDRIPVNLATFIDPSIEADVQRALYKRPRWLQGAELLLDEVSSVWTNIDVLKRVPHNVFSQDKMFRGRLVGHGEEPAVGVLHPHYVGWIALNPDNPINMTYEPTIADLKAHIGKFEPEWAAYQNDKRHIAGTFKVRGRELS